MTRYFSSVFNMLLFVGLIINLIILFRGDFKKKNPLCWKFILIVVFIMGLCLSVVHRSEHLEARIGVCFLDTRVGSLAQKW